MIGDVHSNCKDLVLQQDAKQKLQLLPSVDNDGKISEDQVKQEPHTGNISSNFIISAHIRITHVCNINTIECMAFDCVV